MSDTDFLNRPAAMFSFQSLSRFVVSQNQKALHIVFPHQFLDSPEYFGVSTDDYFQVSITAIDEAKILIWHRDKLKLSIINDEFLQIVFDHILARDVVKKLMQVSQVRVESTKGNQSVVRKWKSSIYLNKKKARIEKASQNI